MFKNFISEYLGQLFVIFGVFHKNVTKEDNRQRH